MTQTYNDCGAVWDDNKNTINLSLSWSCSSVVTSPPNHARSMLVSTALIRTLILMLKVRIIVIFMIQMLKRWEECDTYLTHISRHCWSWENLVRRWNIRSSQQVDRKAHCRRKSKSERGNEVRSRYIESIDKSHLLSLWLVYIYSWWKPQYWMKALFFMYLFCGEIGRASCRERV